MWTKLRQYLNGWSSPVIHPEIHRTCRNRDTCNASTQFIVSIKGSLLLIIFWSTQERYNPRDSRAKSTLNKRKRQQVFNKQMCMSVCVCARAHARLRLLNTISLTITLSHSVSLSFSYSPSPLSLSRCTPNRYKIRRKEIEGLDEILWRERKVKRH